MLRNLLAIVVALTLSGAGPLSRVLAEDDVKLQEAALHHIVDKLPEFTKRLGFPPMKVPGQEFAGPDAMGGQCRVRVARLISSNTAKITISCVTQGDNRSDPDVEWGTLSIYFHWYRKGWTVDKYERSSWMGEFASKDNLLVLFADIEELFSDK